jgi:hypothetical protein
MLICKVKRGPFGDSSPLEVRADLCSNPSLPGALSPIGRQRPTVIEDGFHIRVNKNPFGTQVNYLGWIAECRFYVLGAHPDRYGLALDCIGRCWVLR